MCPLRFSTVQALRAGSVLVLLASLALVGFAKLAARPDALIVDGSRPALDLASPSGTRTPGNDLTRLFLPLHQRVGAWYRQIGRVPGWDPAGFGGRPLVGNPQAGLWYPPVWLVWWSGSPAALGWLTVAHLVWGGLGAFRLAWSLGLPRLAALVAGGAFELSPYLIGQVYAGHGPHVWAACWYPWAFLAALALRRGDPRGGWALPGILALAFLTGHPQEAYYLTLALGAWSGFEFWSRGRRNGGNGKRATPPSTAPQPKPLPRGVGAKWKLLSRWERVAAKRPGEGSPRLDHRSGGPSEGWRGSAAVVGAVVGVVALAVALLAIEWLPAAEAQGWTLTRARLSASRASRYNVDPINLTQLLGPNALGGPTNYLGAENYWESLLSPGGLVLALALVGWLCSERRRASRGWAILVGLSVAFAMGRWLGLFTILYQILPGMDRFRVPARSLFLAALGVAMLAGLGVEAIGRRRDWRPWWRRILILVAVLSGALLTAGYWGADLEHASRPMTETGLWLRAGANLAGDPFAWGTLLVPLAALGWLQWRRGDGRRVAVVLGGLAMAELAVHAFLLIQVAPLERFETPRSLVEALDRTRPAGPFRVRARDVFLEDGQAIALGLEKTNLGDAFQLQHAADLHEWLYPIFDPPRPDELMDPILAWERRRRSQAVLDRMNVALLVSDRPEVGASWPRAASGTVGNRPFWIYRNPTVLPRAYVVPGVWPCRDEARAVSLLPWVDPRESVVMEADPLGDRGDSARQGFTPAEYRSRGPDRIEIVVTTRAPGLLVVADTWMPGWSATLNGRPARIERGNHAQRVVALPRAGRQRVVMTYEPPGLALGGWISGAAVLIWLTGLGWTSGTSFTAREAGE